MLENLTVALAVAAAGAWLIRRLLRLARGKGGCSCGDCGGECPKTLVSKRKKP